MPGKVLWYYTYIYIYDALRHARVFQDEDDWIFIQKCFQKPPKMDPKTVPRVAQIRDSPRSFWILAANRHKWLPRRSKTSPRSLSPRWPKMDPRRHKNGPRPPWDGTKNAPRWLQGVPRWRQMAQDKTLPRCFPDLPKPQRRLQEAAGTLSRRPKLAPKGPKRPLSTRGAFEAGLPVLAELPPPGWRAVGATSAAPRLSRLLRLITPATPRHAWTPRHVTSRHASPRQTDHLGRFFFQLWFQNQSKSVKKLCQDALPCWPRFVDRFLINFYSQLGPHNIQNIVCS